MTQTKTVKLSANMKDVVRKMRDGYKMRWESAPVLVKSDDWSFRVGLTTARGLYERGIIYQSSSDYTLTDLGKSIEL